jgi:dTDP-4-dehydrorhamnose 3,5-epimerase
MEIQRTDIPDVLTVRPKKFGDHRGFFSEVFKNDVLKAQGIDEPWSQDNHSFSAARGVLRGLHFQKAPFAQTKLIRVTRGAILDVAVDIRKASPTYGKHVAVELSAENWMQLLIPVGFAHGFCTLTENVEVIYKVTAPYAPDCEGGVMWNDPELGIEWPVSASEVVLAERDKTWPPLASFDSPF